MKIVFIISLLALVACSSSSNSSSPGGPTAQQDKPNPPTRPECALITIENQDYSYCVWDPAGQLQGLPSWRNTVNLVYYWHGVEGRPEEIFDSTLFTSLRREFGTNMPTLISLSMGPEGVVVGQAAAIGQKLIPALEAKRVPRGLRISRQMMGLSMGGHNALRVAGETPSMFKAVHALCPALVSFDPGDPAEVQNYFHRNKETIDITFANEVLRVFRNHFSKPGDWETTNPFALLKKGRYQSMDLFLSVGREDELGFAEGVERFAKAGPPGPNPHLSLSIVPGRHCSFDERRLSPALRLHLVTGFEH